MTMMRLCKIKKVTVDALFVRDGFSYGENTKEAVMIPEKLTSQYRKAMNKLVEAEKEIYKYCKENNIDI